MSPAVSSLPYMSRTAYDFPLYLNPDQHHTIKLLMCFIELLHLIREIYRYVLIGYLCGFLVIALKNFFSHFPAI